MKILIVDDDLASLRLLAVNLTWGGYEVLEAHDGLQAWDLFQREHTRLIITDWMMPGLDGLGLISRIRGNPHTSYTYIILLTALDSKPQVISGLQGGADDYLTKPFDPDEMLARVRIGERILKLEEGLLTSRRQMEMLAMHDTLTGILNRRAIQDRAVAELSRLRRGSAAISVILLDIDHFKSINDTCGHAVGDEALRLVAGVLIQQVRSYDWVGRWGGEEFLIILPGTSLPDACAVAERIREHILATALPVAGSNGLRLSASLGVASVQADAAGEVLLDDLVREADRALYRAKQQGRNRVCVAEM